MKPSFAFYITLTLSALAVTLLCAQTVPIFAQTLSTDLTVPTGTVVATGPLVAITAPSSSAIVLTPTSSKEVLRINGLAEIRLGNPSPYQGMMYDRPEKPETVVITLTTKDGREWRAKWEAIEPYVKSSP